jgi:hypothetical protein
LTRRHAFVTAKNHLLIFGRFRNYLVFKQQAPPPIERNPAGHLPSSVIVCRNPVFSDTGHDLEHRLGESPRGFESHTLREKEKVSQF